MEQTNDNCYSLYWHFSPSKKIYIGITGVDPKKRWSGGSGYKGCTMFYHAIQKYGWENFQHHIAKTGLTREEASELEKELVKFVRDNFPGRIYNIADGGLHCFSTSVAWNKGIPMSEETKRRISEAKKGISPGNARPVICVETGITYPSCGQAYHAVTGGNPKHSANIKRVCDHVPEHVTAYGYHWEWA